MAEPGLKLSNGATVIARNGNVVLAHWNKGGRIEFVSWCVGDDGSCFWGYYSRDLREALDHFEERSGYAS
jgi:hypothetical protein